MNSNIVHHASSFYKYTTRGVPVLHPHSIVQVAKVHLACLLPMPAIRVPRSSYSGMKTDACPSPGSLSDYLPLSTLSTSDSSSNRHHEGCPDYHSGGGDAPILPPLSQRSVPKCLRGYVSFPSPQPTRKTNSQPTTILPRTLSISQIALVWRLCSLAAPCGRGAPQNLLLTCRGRKRLRTVRGQRILVRVFERGFGREERVKGKESYAVVNDMLVAGVIIDVYCDAAEGGDFRGELIEAGVVLSVVGG